MALSCEEREVLRRAIDSAKKEKLGLPSSLSDLWCGSETGYKHGCRCESCKAASAAARRRRRWRDVESTRRYNAEYKRRYRARKRAAA